MSIFSTVVGKLNPYMLWIKLGAIILAATFVFSTGYKVGEWKQGLADSQEVQDAKDALITNSLNVAAAQKAAREQAAKEYESQLEASDIRHKQDLLALEGYQTANKQLADKNENFRSTIEGLRHDKANANFLDQPIPPAIRDGLLNKH